jgi:hypothetical protein
VRVPAFFNPSRTPIRTLPPRFASFSAPQSFLSSSDGRTLFGPMHPAANLASSCLPLLVAIAARNYEHRAPINVRLSAKSPTLTFRKAFG